jgi:uncharacterized protein
VAETGWLIERQLGSPAEAAFYRSIAAGDIEVVTLTAVDWIRIAELVDRYVDLELGGVDASLIVLAERLRVTQIATLDHRDFAVVRPNHVEAFELLP